MFPPWHGSNSVGFRPPSKVDVMQDKVGVDPKVLNDVELIALVRELRSGSLSDLFHSLRCRGQRMLRTNRSHFIQNVVAIERSPKSIPMVS